jgi:hypothetical protein
MTPPRIGSLCTGYGGLDMAVQAVYSGTVAWHADIDPGASAILAHRHPHIPNLGDITAVDYAQVEPVEILTAGFPCQDVSVAGQRAGIAEGTRSGLWLHVARAIRELRPSLVVIENVRGLLSARADSDMEPCPWCLGDHGGAESILCGHLALFSQTWPASGSMRSGVVYPPPPSEPPTNASGSSSPHGLPTPRARDWKDGGKDGLHEQVRKLFPTPRASDGEKGGPNQRGSKGDLALPSAVAQLLPTPRTSDSHGGGSTVMEAPTCEPPSAASLLPTPTSNLAINGGTQHPAKRRAGGHQPSIADVIEHLGAATPPPSTGGKQ